MLRPGGMPEPAADRWKEVSLPFTEQKHLISLFQADQVSIFISFPDQSAEALPEPPFPSGCPSASAEYPDAGVFFCVRRPVLQPFTIWIPGADKLTPVSQHLL